MLTKHSLLLLILLITITYTWDFSTINQQKIPTATTCDFATSCRSPTLSQYKYNGTIKTGYLNIDRNGSALSFIFFGRVNTAKQQLRNYPLIVSLGGGPGASAHFNSFRQYGPLNLKKVFSISVQDNKYTWARDANLLFIDQPIGTGLSCASDINAIPTKMQDVVIDFYRGFNQIFIDKGGCFGSDNLNIPPSTPMFIFGEGYGGKFASAIAAKFVKEKINGGKVTGLKGVGIGGGLNNPFRLMSQIGNYGFSLGMLDYQERIRMEKIILRANFNQQNKQWARMTTDFQRTLSYLYERTGVSYYDITQDGFQQDLVQYFFSPALGNLKKFQYQTSIPFESMSKQVYSKLAADFMQPETQSLQFLLNSKIPILLYQGQDDAYSNPTGAMRWIEELRHANSQEFRDKNLQAWKVNGIMFGSTKSAGKLTFIIVNKAGHYVAKDNPEAAYYMFSNWIKSNLS